MSRVDFYVLPGSGETARQRFACRLAEKAYRLDNRVHVQVHDAQSAHQLDDQLWTFRDGSFVPHEIVHSDASPAESPVTIGHGPLPGSQCDLLINLTEEVPADLTPFPRVAEIVTSDDESRQRSRQRYSRYRELGHELESHKL